MAVKQKKKAGSPKKVVTEVEAVETYTEPQYPPVEDSVTEAPAVQIPETKKHVITEEQYEEFEQLKAKNKLEALEEKERKEDYSYFGQFEAGSALPAWAMPKQCEQMKDDITRIENALRLGAIPSEERYQEEEKLEMYKKRYEDIYKAKPKLTAAQKDRLSHIRDDLGTRIGEAMFTEYQMEKGTADPHEEATRMSEPIMHVDPLEARRMGIKLAPGNKTSRTNAENMWKMACSLLGDTAQNPNVETLRPRMGNGGKKRTNITVPAMPWLKNDGVKNHHEVGEE